MAGKIKYPLGEFLEDLEGIINLFKNDPTEELRNLGFPIGPDVGGQKIQMAISLLCPVAYFLKKYPVSLNPGIERERMILQRAEKMREVISFIYRWESDLQKMGLVRPGSECCDVSHKLFGVLLKEQVGPKGVIPKSVLSKLKTKRR